MKKILVINGVNLNMLGIREPVIYGNTTLHEIEEALVAYGKNKNAEITCFHSNFEGETVEKIHDAYQKYDGIIINAGAHSHYSYAIRDAIAAVGIKTVEVHISNVFKREGFRHNSVIAPVCAGCIMGLGAFGYKAAVDFILES